MAQSEPRAAGEPPRTPSHVIQGSRGEESRMVDVSQKDVTAREALARAVVVFPPGLLRRVLAQGGPKGPILEVARTAGVLAAKRTDEWIPLCHTLGLDALELDFEERGDELEIRCRALCRGRTGVEMEAMVGASAAALTVYDMTKGLDHGIAIRSVELLEKRGGRSGPWRKP